MQDYLLDMKYPIEPTSRRRSPGVVAHFDAFFATRGTVGTRSWTRSRAIRGSTHNDRVGCRYRTIYGGSPGSASLPAPVKWLGSSTPTVYSDDSTLTETKAFVSVHF